MDQNQINSNLKEKVKIKKWILNNCVKDYNSIEQYPIKKTNKILENNIQQMANELDNLLEIKMELELTIMKKDGNNNIVDDLNSNNTMNFNSTHIKQKVEIVLFLSRVNYCKAMRI